MGLVIKNGVLEKYEGSEKKVVIPEGVTCIGREAFRWNNTIESIIIPDSVETIKEYAFVGCKGIKSLDIPKSVKTIGFLAFNYCGMERVTIPPTVKEVSFGAFNGVKEITVYDNLQSSIAELWDFTTMEEFSFAVTVLSENTGEVISRVPISTDGSYRNRLLIEKCCQGNALFDLPLLDESFRKQKSPKVKTFIAEFRINNPYDLSDENRDMYAKYLKRTAKKREKREKEEEFFEIKGKTLKKYKGIDKLSVVQVPEGINKLGIGAFGQVDNTITDIILPEGLITIDGNLYSGNMVFGGCKKLKRVVVPDTLIDIPHDAFDIYVRKDDSEDSEKVKLEFNEYDNGLYLGNACNPYVCLVEISDKSIESLSVHEGCKIICGNAFLHCGKLRTIVLPDSLVKIEERSYTEWVESLGRFMDTKNIYSKNDLKINMPANYFRTTMKLPVRVTYDLLSVKWKDQVTLTDLAWIYLFQSGIRIEGFCKKKFIDKNQAVKEMLAVCTEKPSETAIAKLAKYAYFTKAAIQKDQILEIIQLAEREGVTSGEIDQLKIIAGVASKADIDELDQYCREKYDSKTIDDIISRSSLSLDTALKKYPVKYKATKKEASQFVLKCVIASYTDSFSGNEPKARIIKDADELAAKLDSNMFSKFIDKITERPMLHVLLHGEYWEIGPIDRLLSLVGRFGDERNLDRLIDGYESFESKNVGINRSTKYSSYQNYLKAAILLNDSQKALSYCVEKGWGKEYASIRGKKLSELTNMVAADEEWEIVEAISVYEDVVTKIKKLVADDGTYSDPTVAEAPVISRIRTDNEMAHKFYSTLRDFYAENTHRGGNDYRFSPEELYKNWIDNDRVEKGHIGISFSIGLLVASYMFESKDIKGRLVFCRNYWEYSGNASEPTRIVLEVSSEADNWKVFIESGYDKYDM